MGRELDKAVAAVARNAFADRGAVSRESLGRLARDYVASRSPFVMEGSGGQPFCVALVLPALRAMGEAGGEGPLCGLALARGDGGARPLVGFRVPGGRLGPACAHAARRAAVLAVGRPDKGAASRWPEAGDARPPAAIPSRRPPADRSAWSDHDLLAHPESVLAGPVASLLGDASPRAPLDCHVSVSVVDGTAYANVRLGDGGHVTLGSWPSRAGVDSQSEHRIPAGGRLWVVPSTSPCLDGLALLAVRALAAPLAGEVRAARDAAFAAFRGRLDRRILDCMRTVGHDGVDLYNWIDAGGRVGDRLNRRQALGAYPVIALVSGDPEVTAAVDGARPLVDALASALGTSPACAKALRGLSVGEMGAPRAFLGDLPRLSGLAARSLPNRNAEVPVGQQFSSAFDVSRAWSGLCDGPLAAGSASVAERLSREPPVWQRRDGRARCARLAREAMDAVDFAREFARHLLMPLVLDASPLPHRMTLRHLWDAPSLPSGREGSAIAVALFRDRGLAEVVSISEAWHRSCDAIEVSLASGLPLSGIAWPALTAAYPATAGDGDMRVVPLTTPSELSDEGRRLSHCVGSYARQCLRGEVHIVSVRRRGESLSTAEIKVERGPGDAPALVVRQHRGAGNEDPPHGAARLLAAYLDAVVDGSLALEPAALDARGAEDPEDVPPCVAYLGYDPDDPAARDHALALYGFALPSDERDMTHAEWAGRLGLADLLAGVVGDFMGDRYHNVHARREVGEEAWDRMRGGEGRPPAPAPRPW